MRRIILTLMMLFTIAACSNEEAEPNEDMTNSENENEETADTETDTESEAADEEETDESASVSSNRGNGNTEDDESDSEDSEETTEGAASDDEVPAEPADLLADTERVEGYWINYSGEDDARSHMTRTEPIEYNSDQDYTVTAASYVSYFYGNEFIKTNNYGHDGPHVIEKVPEANRLVISFSEPEQDDIELIDAATDEASAGNEVNTTPDELIGRGQPNEEEMSGTRMFGQDFLSGDEVYTGERIDSEGEFVEDPDYYVTGALPYSASGDYVITAPAFVSFYNGRNFIETIEFTSVPAYLQQVNGANYINISFHDDNLLDLNIIEIE